MNNNNNNNARFIAFYLALVLTIAGLAYAPWVLSSYNMFPSEPVFIFMIIGGASPTLAALIVSRLEFGKRGPDYLFRQFTLRGFDKKWLLVAALLPLTLAAFSVILWHAFGGSYVLDFLKLIEFLPILLSNFLVNMWEEVGWRGYALPALQRRYSALVSSLMVGAFWALWHWPHFAVKESAMAANYHNFLYFFVSTLFISISYTWLYNSTNGNLFAVSLYHASTNSANIVLFLQPGISYSVFPFYFLVLTSFSAFIVLFFKPDSLSRFGRKKAPDLLLDQNGRRNDVGRTKIIFIQLLLPLMA
ncbi:MAG: CPBP family intramembrane metalloprotease [Candidatus Methanomethyliaceae archaeon]|nr:CPBP family intramembrane metalloprotease [Candidatus Methanomethyliaceae archaeon]